VAALLLVNGEAGRGKAERAAAAHGFAPVWRLHRHRQRQQERVFFALEWPRYCRPMVRPAAARQKERPQLTVLRRGAISHRAELAVGVRAKGRQQDRAAFALAPPRYCG